MTAYPNEIVSLLMAWGKGHVGNLEIIPYPGTDSRKKIKTQHVELLTD